MTPINYIVESISFEPSVEAIASPSDDEWENIIITAIALGLAPLLHWRLEQAAIQLPPMAMAKLALTRQAHTRRNHDIGAQLAQILSACQAHNVQAVVLKGALLAPTLYADPALRPMNDIDLLFRPEDLFKVGQILESLGYAGKHKRPDQGPGILKHLSTYRRAGNEGQTPNPYLSPGGDRMVEPHGSLEEAWFGLKVNITPGIWERIKPISLHGQPAYRLSIDDMLLHLAVHATFHVIMGQSVFVQLYDIGQVIRSWGDEVDWSELLRLSRAAQAHPFVYAGLYWAKTLYKAPLPDQPLISLAQACPPNLLTYIQSLAAPGLLRRTQNPPLTTLGQRLWRGLLDRQETARWAISWPKKWQVWQTALAFHKTDTAGLLKRKLTTLADARQI